MSSCTFPVPPLGPSPLASNCCPLSGAPCLNPDNPPAAPLPWLASLSLCPCVWLVPLSAVLWIRLLSPSYSRFYFWNSCSLRTITPPPHPTPSWQSDASGVPGKRCTAVLRVPRCPLSRPTGFFFQLTLSTGFSLNCSFPGSDCFSSSFTHPWV